jgi:hypothetical protein
VVQFSQTPQLSQSSAQSAQTSLQLLQRVAHDEHLWQSSQLSSHWEQISLQSGQITSHSLQCSLQVAQIPLVHSSQVEHPPQSVTQSPQCTAQETHSATQFAHLPQSSHRIVQSLQYAPHSSQIVAQFPQVSQSSHCLSPVHPLQVPQVEHKGVPRQSAHQLQSGQRSSQSEQWLSLSSDALAQKSLTQSPQEPQRTHKGGVRQSQQLSQELHFKSGIVQLSAHL